MRNRSAMVIIENNKVLLIKRIRNGSVYYVFPGGGIENRETPEMTAKREALEELGVHIKIMELFAELQYNGTHSLFLAEIIGGQVGTGKGDEYTDETRGRGTYEPLWVNISNLLSLDVRPREVAMKIVEVNKIYEDRRKS